MTRWRNQPVTGMTTAMVSMNAVDSHWALRAVTSNSTISRGIALTMIVSLRMTTKVAVTSQRRTAYGFGTTRFSRRPGRGRAGRRDLGRRDRLGRRLGGRARCHGLLLAVVPVVPAGRAVLMATLSATDVIPISPATSARAQVTAQPSGGVLSRHSCTPYAGVGVGPSLVHALGRSGRVLSLTPARPTPRGRVLSRHSCTRYVAVGQPSKAARTADMSAPPRPFSEVSS